MSFVQLKCSDVAVSHTVEDESRVEILNNYGCARRQIRFHVTRSYLHRPAGVPSALHQHSSGEITYGVSQSGIYRPRTQVVDRVGEQLGNVVHAFEWASDILEDAGRACRTLRLATTFA